MQRTSDCAHTCARQKTQSYRSIITHSLPCVTLNVLQGEGLRIFGDPAQLAPNAGPTCEPTSPSSTAAVTAPAPAPRAKALEEEPEPAEWDDECFHCGKEGRLTCCDVCPRAFHLRCLPAADSAFLKNPANAESDWFCPRCRKVAKAVFCMSRELSHPALAEPGAAEDVARRLFDFMVDPDHEAHWDPVREAGSALLLGMPLCAPWQPSKDATGRGRADAQRAAYGPAQQAADLLATRVTPGGWAGACAEPESSYAEGSGVAPRKKPKVAG